MNRVLHLIEQFGKPRQIQTPASVIPAGQPCMLSFDFIEAGVETEAFSENFTGSLGRTEACISAVSLTAPQCLSEISTHKETQVAQLPQALGHGSTAEQPGPRSRSHQQSAPVTKIRASALLEASELISIPSKYRAREHAEPAVCMSAGKQIGLDLLRKTGESTSEHDLLAKVRHACEKIQADALYGQPVRTLASHHRRHKIQIKIG